MPSATSIWTRWRTAIVLAVFSPAIAIAMVRVLDLAPQQWLNYRWRSELDDSPVEQVSEVLEEIAAFGKRGLPMLVEASDHRRTVVASATRHLLLAELAQWRFLAPREAAQRIAHLASELARQIPTFSNGGRRFAGMMAMRILLWPADNRHLDSNQLVADCETVFRNSGRPTSHRNPLAANPDDAAQKESTETLDDLPSEVLAPPPLPSWVQAQRRSQFSR